MRPFQYQRAAGVREAIAKAEGCQTCSFLAGGTTVIDLVKLDVEKPEMLIDVGRLPMDTILRDEEGGLIIGANVRNSDLAWHSDVQRDYKALSEALLSGASPQLRNRATTAGNLMQRTRCPYFRDNYSPCNKREPGSDCAALAGYNRSHAVLGGSDSCIATHPSDMCVALAAFEATIRVEGPNGSRSIPFADFHLLPGDTPHLEHALEQGELITAVTLPPKRAGTASTYLKSRDRASYEFALASAAVSFGIEEGCIVEPKIALGGVATKPWRCYEAEKNLEGQVASLSVYEKAAEVALAEAEVFECNAFKVPLARNLLARALSEVEGRLARQSEVI
ncbi:xanthine dehydrogenase family protein subunit M [Pelagicoccus sp. SDUM812002]|uniref:FAD binding domain-containing protein n=1 Tax=Pelagicoccus sp. SDUM812002 TaxID=3041266 RepID=UPI00280CB224|nr:xanthine dehydrogenase family protein subunit M [Pelagicoccus sp. SDUM812002]MDQ8188424.1 xanthine dehydrogenase family protein subunit M [Pelagicoccus sp. SDUM812002]